MTRSTPEDPPPVAQHQLTGEQARDEHARPAFSTERRQQILELVRSHGRVWVRDLAATAGVTETTIRKDIIDLDRAGLLRRTHGGAIAVQPLYEPPIADRTAQHLGAKQSIARACLAEIQDGDAVYLDSGTTTAEIAGLLASTAIRLEGIRVPANANVLTNALAVATALSDAPQIRHTVLGGQFRPVGGCFVGPLAVDALERFTLNTAFIGVSGISRTGLTVADGAEAQVKQAAMNQSRRVIVPMDQSKVGVTDFVRVCPLNRVNIVITDRADGHLQQLCDEAGVDLRVAS